MKVPLQNMDIEEEAGMCGEAQIAHIFAQVENPSDHAISIQLPKTGSNQGKPRNYFSLWDFMISLLARNCCCAHTIQDTDIIHFYLNLYTTNHIYEKNRVWRASENSNYWFNIKAFKYFMADWGKHINLPCSKQLCLSRQDPNTKHEWWSTHLAAGFSEVLRSHKFH